MGTCGIQRERYGWRSFFSASTYGGGGGDGWIFARQRGTLPPPPRENLPLIAASIIEPPTHMTSHYIYARRTKLSTWMMKSNMMFS